MKLPRILVLDDLWFWSRAQRERVCRRLGLFDATDGGEPENTTDYVAIAEFRSGQLRQGNEIVNDLDLAIRQIESRWRSEVDHRWALVLLDLQFDKGLVHEGEIDPNTNWPHDTEPDFGLRILQEMVDHWPDQESGTGVSEIPVVIMSTFERAERGAAANRAGALRYVEKGSLDRTLLEELLDQVGLIEDGSNRILGHSTALLKTLRRAREAGRTARGNVLILGKMGSGKTILAEYIHQHSSRRKRQMQRFTVSEGMDATLLKAQLYGFWHGAYTPADRSEAGLAERAHQSTLFLDEIANLPPTAQSELLEFGRLRTDGMRELSRLGSFPTAPPAARSQALGSVVGQLDRNTQRIAVDVFLITATNKPLDDPDYVRAAGFLPDLLTRLGREYFSYITFPTVKDRPEDIVILFEEFLRQATEASGGAWPKVLDHEVTQRLEAYPWNGNVAEIQGVAREVERASRHWHEVHGRHLGNFDNSIRKATYSGLAETAAGDGSVTGSELAATQSPLDANTLAETCNALRSVHFVGLRRELEGALPSFRAAYGEALIRLLAAALEYTRELSRPLDPNENASRASSRQKKSETLGDLNPTKAMKLLLHRSKLSTSEAQDEIKRLFARLEVIPEPDSSVGRVLTWARSGRRGSR